MSTAVGTDFERALDAGVARILSLQKNGGWWVAELESNVTMTAQHIFWHEFLRIADTPEGFSYYASPGGRPAVEFKVKELGDRRVVFENAAHDFPQRILYWRDGDKLVARIEGTIGGKGKSEEWRFARVP